MCGCDPRRLVVLVPAHHDASRWRWSRLDRHRPLIECLGSLTAAVDCWRSTGTRLAFDDVRVVLVDDGSPTPLATILPPEVRDGIDVLRLEARRGQGGALNEALRRHPAAAYAFTDSDCVVAPDWITTIEKLAATDDGTDGSAGPPWRHGRPATRKAAWLTSQETALIRHCTDRARRDGVERIDCRNAWLRATVAGKLGRRDFFPEDAGAALSGITSRVLASAGVRLGFDPALVVHHEPLTSVRAQAVTYFRRGATSGLDRHYAAGHRSLTHAFAATYLKRHIVEPTRAGVSPAYVLLAHGSYWCGLAWHRRTTAR